MAALRPCDDLQKKAFDEANTVMNADPGVKLFMAICTPAVPGAAEAVKQSGRTDVKVIGLGLPNDNKRYVHEGITDCVVLWNTMDLGYLTVQAARALADGTLKPGDTQLRGRPARVRSRSRATTSCSASRSSSPKTTSTSSTSDRPSNLLDDAPGDSPHAALTSLGGRSNPPVRHGAGVDGPGGAGRGRLDAELPPVRVPHRPLGIDVARPA